MGILKRLFGSAPKDAGTLPKGLKSVEVVGIEYRGPLRKSAGQVTFYLIREPGNEHDTNAIAVHYEGKHIGYIPRELAALYSIDMDMAQLHVMTAPGQIYDSYTARVWLEPPEHRWPVVPPLPQYRHIPWGRASIPVELDDERAFSEGVREALAAAGRAATDEGVEADDQSGVVVAEPHELPVVYVNGFPVGRVPADDAGGYLAALNRLAHDGAGLGVRARVWARCDGSRLFSRVTVEVPPPDEVFVPAGLPAAPHVVLPPGRKVQVSGEDEYMSDVAGYCGRPVVATLHELVRQRGRPLVEVRVCGKTVGRLTPGMSEHYLPVVQAMAQRGKQVACRARVEGNQLKADVILDATRSGDLPSEWIQRHLD